MGDDALIIGIDVDGILADFNRGYIPLLEYEAKTVFPKVSKDYPNTWNYDSEQGVTKEQRSKVWAGITASHSFWYSLPPYSDAGEFLIHLKMMEKDGDTVHFVTNRLGESVGIQTSNWLKDHGFDSAHVIVTSEKGKSCNDLEIDVYLDDKVENCEDVATNTATWGFMLARPWNHPVPDIHTVNSLDEFYHCLKLMKFIIQEPEVEDEAKPVVWDLSQEW